MMMDVQSVTYLRDLFFEELLTAVMTKVWKGT